MTMTYTQTGSLSNIPTCWTIINQKPVVVDYGVERRLPAVSKIFKRVLDDHEISYIEEGELLYIYDPDYFETGTVTMPVYSYQGLWKGYTCINKKYTGVAYTFDTADAAHKIYKKMEPIFKEYEKYSKLMNLLGENSGVAFAGYLEDSNNEISLYGHKFGIYQVLYRDDRCNCIGISTKPYMTVLVKLDDIPKDEPFTITVKDYLPIGKLVGISGWQAKRISEFFGFNRVKFESDTTV